MTFKVFAPGEVAKSEDFNDNFNKLFKLDSEKAINDISTTNSGELAASSQVLIDKFLNVTGQNNTIDTTNTDSLYTHNSHICNGDLTPTTDTSNTSWQSNYGYPYFYGVKIYAKKNINLYQVLKASGCSATVCKILDSSGTVLATANFSGNYATFNYTILEGHTYQIGAYIDGSTAYTRTDKHPFSYPVNGTNVNFTGPVGDSNYIFNIQGIITTDYDNYDNFVNSVLQSTPKTIPAGKTKVFITPLLYEELATGDSITADISLDGGTTYTTNIPLNTWSDITSTDGTSLIAKLNLNTGDGSTTPKIKGWRVLLE